VAVDVEAPGPAAAAAADCAPELPEIIMGSH